MGTDDLLSALEALMEGAKERKTAYYIHNTTDYEETDNFCRDCGLKVVERYSTKKVFLVRDNSGEDSPQHCVVCEAPLDVELSAYGEDQELEHFLRLAPINAHTPPDEWKYFFDAIAGLPDNDKRWPEIRERVTSSIRGRHLLALELNNRDEEADE